MHSALVTVRVRVVLVYLPVDGEIVSALETVRVRVVLVYLPVDGERSCPGDEQ